MPGARRVRKGQTGVGRNAQIRTGAPQNGNGVDKYDGRANTNAGSPKAQPKEFSGKGTVVKTY